MAACVGLLCPLQTRPGHRAGVVPSPSWAPPLPSQCREGGGPCGAAWGALPSPARWRGGSVGPEEAPPQPGSRPSSPLRKPETAGGSPQGPQPQAPPRGCPRTLVLTPPPLTAHAGAAPSLSQQAPRSPKLVPRAPPAPAPAPGPPFCPRGSEPRATSGTQATPTKSRTQKGVCLCSGRPRRCQWLCWGGGSCWVPTPSA